MTVFGLIAAGIRALVTALAAFKIFETHPDGPDHTGKRHQFRKRENHSGSHPFLLCRDFGHRPNRDRYARSTASWAASSTTLAAAAPAIDPDRPPIPLKSFFFG